MPLFAAASTRENQIVAERDELVAALRPMTSGGEAAEDYGYIGSTLRNHPITFLREALAKRRIVTWMRFQSPQLQ